jgi:hypothetical protein
MAKDKITVVSIETLKEKAFACVNLKDPLLAYKRHLKGRESEYTYRQFLDELAKKNAPAEESPAVEVTPEPEANAND